MKNKYSNTSVTESKARNLRVSGGVALSCSLMLGLASIGGIPAAFAAEAKINLGTNESYSVLGGQSVTNTGASVLAQDLGVSPGTSITGFPPGITLGTIHATDAHAAQAQSDLVVAYDDAASRAPTASVSGDLVGQTLVGGVYNSSGPLELSGTVTLDAQGDPNTVFIFQVASTLTTASSSTVALINGAQACNVYWQIGSSATLGTDSDFKGSILALTSISATTDTTVEGRALARNGSVTLDNNIFQTPGCATTLDETPVDETPVEETPVETPVENTPVVENPVEDAPPVVDVPENTPVVDTPPAVNTPVVPPVVDTPPVVEETPPTITEIPDTSTDLSTDTFADVPTDTFTDTSTDLFTGTPDNSTVVFDENDNSGRDSIQREELANTGAGFNFLVTIGAFALGLGGAIMTLASRQPKIARKH